MNHDDTTNTTDREDASDLQRWIDGLLRSSDAAGLEVAPASTHAAATTAIKQLRRYRKRRQALAVFASAAVMTAIALWAPPTPPDSAAPGSARGSNNQAIVPQRATPGQRLGLQDIARFETNGDTIAVSLESPSPNVTVVQLYPTTTAERRAQTDLFLRQLLTDEPNGG